MAATKEQLQALKEPMPYKFRVQSSKYGKSTILSYIDSRQVQDRLDEAVGVENWGDEYRIIGDNLFCGISIKVQDENGGDKWVTKWDVGVESNVDKEKGNSSDSFKRSAVKWGVGRFLYSLKTITLKSVTHTNNKEYPAKKDGTILWDVDSLTEYCKELLEQGITDDTKFSKPATKAPTKPAQKATPAPKPADPVKTEPTKPTKPSQANLTAGKVTPSTEFNTTPEEERKNKAKLAFGKLDKAKVLSHLIRNKNLKFTDINTFIEGTPIEDVLAIYDEVKEFKAK